MIDPAAQNNSVPLDAKLHIQDTGNKDFPNAKGTAILGTTGKSKRLEAITLSLPSKSIQYETHIQNLGWTQGVKTSGVLAGTQGRALRLEAVRISLTGDMKSKYDIYYRTHIQNIGWTGWAKNGQSCGSAGYSYRMEALQIVIVQKGAVAPGVNLDYFYKR
jgi:uncharacterized protein YjdB